MRSSGLRFSWSAFTDRYSPLSISSAKSRAALFAINLLRCQEPNFKVFTCPFDVLGSQCIEFMIILFNTLKPSRERHQPRIIFLYQTDIGTIV